MLIQRLGSSTQKKDEFTDSLIKEIKKHPNSCDEIWLASDYGFPAIEKHKDSAAELKAVAEKFRKNGIRVSLQISNTIGHGEYMSSRDCSGLVYEGSPVGKMVGHDGTVAGYCFCPNNEYFREYVKSYVKEYSKILPDCVWIDDDLRMSNHDPVRFGCFCDDCIDKFNKKYGSDFSREKLVQEINFGKPEWREKYIEFVRETMYSFTYMIAEAVHEVSPDSVMGYQYCAHGGYTGYGYSYIFDAMRKATGFIPKTRPGGGAYDDYDMNAFFDKAHIINWQNFMLPEYIEEKCPEIENLPDVKFGKTIAGTCFETTYYFACGNTSMSYALLMNDYEPMEWHGEMLAAFSEHFDYWKMLAEYSRNTSQAGIVIAYPKKMYMKKAEKEFDWNGELWFTGGVELEKCAVPAAYSHDDTSVYFLHGDCAELMTDEELEYLLDKPVITDGKTLAILNRRGVKIGADAEKISVRKLYAEYTKHEINRGFEGGKWSIAIYFADGYKIIDKDGSAEPLGIYKTNAAEAENTGEIASAVINTHKGAKWAVFGDNLWNKVISSEKRQQILNTAEYLKPGRITAVLQTHVKAVVLPRENKEHKLTSVTVTNCTVGKSGSLKLRLRNPAGEKFLFMSQYNGRKELSFERDNGDYLIEIPSVDAWSSATVFVM